MHALHLCPLTDTQNFFFFSFFFLPKVLTERALALDLLALEVLAIQYVLFFFFFFSPSCRANHMQLTCRALCPNCTFNMDIF